MTTRVFVYESFKLIVRRVTPRAGEGRPPIIPATVSDSEFFESGLMIDAMSNVNIDFSGQEQALRIVYTITDGTVSGVRTPPTARLDADSDAFDRDLTFETPPTISSNQVTYRLPNLLLNTPGVITITPIVIDVINLNGETVQVTDPEGMNIEIRIVDTRSATLLSGPGAQVTPGDGVTARVRFTNVPVGDASKRAFITRPGQARMSIPVGATPDPNDSEVLIATFDSDDIGVLDGDYVLELQTIDDRSRPQRVFTEIFRFNIDNPIRLSLAGIANRAATTSTDLRLAVTAVGFVASDISLTLTGPNGVIIDSEQLTSLNPVITNAQLPQLGTYRVDLRASNDLGTLTATREFNRFLPYAVTDLPLPPVDMIPFTNTPYPANRTFTDELTVMQDYTFLIPSSTVSDPDAVGTARNPAGFTTTLIRRTGLTTTVNGIEFYGYSFNQVMPNTYTFTFPS